MIGSIGAIYLSWSILKYVGCILMGLLALAGLYRFKSKQAKARGKVEGKKFYFWMALWLFVSVNLAAWNTGVRQQDLDRSAFNAPEAATLVQKVERKRVTAEKAQQDYQLTVESKDATLQEMREAEARMNRATVEFKKEKEKLKEAVDKPETAQ